MYTRAETCALALIDTDKFKALQRRLILPTPSANGTRRTEAYTALDVLTVATGEALSAEVGSDRGLSSRVAMAIASGARDHINAAFVKAEASDLWIGWVAKRSGYSTAMGQPAFGHCVGGPLPRITAELARDEKLQQTSFRMFLVNASAVIREVQQRAKAEKIYFPTDAADAAN